MRDRYVRLFTLPENLYSTGSPVLIAAGTLLKDSQTGKVIAQLKLKSLTSTAIKAVKVRFTFFDSAGNPLEKIVEYDYLDLDTSRDMEFGQKTPILVPNAKSRSYAVSVIEVVFDSLIVWTPEEDNWEPLSCCKALAFQDPELLKQYKIRFGNRSTYETTREKDLWRCTCGALNHEEEDCHSCGNSLLALQNLNLAELTVEKDLRLAQEAQQAAQEQQRLAEEKAARQAVLEAMKKKGSKLLKKAIPLVLVLLIIWVSVTQIVPAVKYHNAISLIEEGKYDEAIEILEELEDYRDSKQQLIEARKAQKKK